MANLDELAIITVNCFVDWGEQKDLATCKIYTPRIQLLLTRTPTALMIPHYLKIFNHWKWCEHAISLLCTNHESLWEAYNIHGCSCSLPRGLTSTAHNIANSLTATASLFLFDRRYQSLRRFYLHTRRLVVVMAEDVAGSPLNFTGDLTRYIKNPVVATIWALYKVYMKLSPSIPQSISNILGTRV